MATLAELQAKRAQLVEDRSSSIARMSLASPVTRREVESRPVAEITAAIDALDREIANLSGRRVRTFLPTFSKGL